MQLEKSVKSFLKLEVTGKRLQPATIKGGFSKDPHKKIKRVRLILLGFSLVIIILILGSAFMGQKKIRTTKLKETQAPPSEANLELKEVSYSSINKANVKEWDLHAKSGQYFKDENKIVLKDLEIILYHSDGKVYRLTGKHGELDTATQDISINGDIKGVIPNNTKITTESLFYNHKDRIISTHDQVFITRDEFSIEGSGMIVNLNEEKLTLLDKVQASGVQ